MPTLVSIQTGKVQTLTDAEGNEWTSGYEKKPIQTSVFVSQTNLSGDEHHLPGAHGGDDRVILAYCANHYPLWNEELGQQLPYGAFAENFTIEGINENTVCIGDTYQIGNIIQVQVSQPRRPCNNISRYWNIKNLTDRVRETGRTGWYMRVLRGGIIEAGTPIRLLDRPYPQWTIAKAHEVYNNRKTDPELAHVLADCEYLEAGWRERLASA